MPKYPTLKPCVWCGNDVNLVVNRFSDIIDPKKKYYYTMCNSCEATGPVEATKLQAIKTWNMLDFVDKGYVPLHDKPRGFDSVPEEDRDV